MCLSLFWEYCKLFPQGKRQAVKIWLLVWRKSHEPNSSYKNPCPILGLFMGIIEDYLKLVRLG